MDTNKINKCPNCDGRNFGAFGNGGASTNAAIVSANQKEDGSWELDSSKFAIVTPIVCDKCGFVSLYRDI